MAPVKSIIKWLYFSIHRRHLFGQFGQFGQCMLNIVYVFHLDKLIELPNESAFWIFVKIHCIRSNMLLFSRLIPVTFVIWKHSIVPFLRIHLLLCFVFLFFRCSCWTMLFLCIFMSLFFLSFALSLSLKWFMRSLTLQRNFLSVCRFSLFVYFDGVCAFFFSFIWRLSPHFATFI